MKNLLTCLLLMASLASVAQNTQTVRGTILDGASKSPIAGASVLVLGTNNGTASDAQGRFKLTGVPVGRVNLKISFIGYEDLFLRDIVVNSGKEVVMDLALTESLTKLEEVNITYSRSEDATVTNNEMTTLSARPFNPTETLKFAGALGDPSRMAANFAGVSGANDSRNDIIVRGNSPATLLWRIDGVNIPNPNHFGSLGTSGGPVSMLNSNLLAKSDFLTSAFPAEYGNALGSVFDLRLRKGNDEKREYLTQVAFNGFELGAEGPYSSKSKASYVANYRYSVFGLFAALGFKLAGTPNYQDLTFKTDIPVGKKGELTFWTIGGASNITFLGKDVSTNGDSYGDENNNTRVKYSTGMAALSYKHRFNDKTSAKITFSASRSTQNFKRDSVIYAGLDTKEVTREIRIVEADFVNEKASVNLSLNHKFNARDKIVGGVIADFNQFELKNTAFAYPSDLDPLGRRSQDKVLRDVSGETLLSQAYLQWKHRFSERLTLNLGATGLYYELSGSTSLEPRAGLSYGLADGSAINLGYGLHSNLQPVLTYFYQTQNPDGTYSLTNKDLGFTRSHHFVLGYERQLAENLRLKVETYYQAIFDAPVERNPSYYSILTEGADFAPIDKANLVNKGTGSNMGIELTLEKNFSNNYYFLLTGSVFDAKYKGSDGIERNSPFNSHYVFNVLAGKDFIIGKRDNVLTLSWKLTSAGGRYVRPINLEASKAARYTVYDDARAFEQQQDGYFRTDLKISYKLNRKRLTHEIALDLQNVTANQNVFQQAYNARTGRIGTAYQQGFLPVPFYRLTF
jgi:hypothetical protein